MELAFAILSIFVFSKHARFLKFEKNKEK